MEHEKQARELEREADRLEEHSEEIHDRIEEARREWEGKKSDQAVPGAQPNEEEADQSDESTGN
jgi:hypothetical protein